MQLANVASCPIIASEENIGKMLKRVFTTVMMLALCLCSGCPLAHAFTELAVVAEQCCCCEEEEVAVAQECSASDTCCCTVSDSHNSLPSNEQSSIKSADSERLARPVISFLTREMKVLDACTIIGARRKPLHLASNKTYLLYRVLLI
jgi:hypothetical protein